MEALFSANLAAATGDRLDYLLSSLLATLEGIIQVSECPALS